MCARVHIIASLRTNIYLLDKYCVCQCTMRSHIPRLEFRVGPTVDLTIPFVSLHRNSSGTLNENAYKLSTTFSLSPSAIHCTSITGHKWSQVWPRLGHGLYWSSMLNWYITTGHLILLWPTMRMSFPRPAKEVWWSSITKIHGRPWNPLWPDTEQHFLLPATEFLWPAREESMVSEWPRECGKSVSPIFVD